MSNYVKHDFTTKPLLQNSPTIMDGTDLKPPDRVDCGEGRYIRLCEWEPEVKVGEVVYVNMRGFICRRADGTT